MGFYFPPRRRDPFESAEKELPGRRAVPKKHARQTRARAPLPGVRARAGGVRLATTALRARPQIRRDDPLNLSILLSGGKETNKDSPSSGERRGKSPAPNPPSFTGVGTCGVKKSVPLGAGRGA